MNEGTAGLEMLCGNWSELGERAMQVRHAVFVVEQGVPPELEHDEWDALSVHVIASIGPQVIGAGRLLPDGHVGRLAVAKAWRGRAIGAALVERLTECARQAGMRELVLNAQVQAEGFYQRLGYVAEGPVFMEAGIAHRAMRRRLESAD